MTNLIGKNIEEGSFTSSYYILVNSNLGFLSENVLSNIYLGFFGRDIDGAQDQYLGPAQVLIGLQV